MGDQADGPDGADQAVEIARDRVARYEAAGSLQRVALRLTKLAPDRAERERVRRHRLGLEGRVAEDVLHAVTLSEPIWDLLAEKDLPEDISGGELAEIQDAIIGRALADESTPRVSLRFHDDEVSVASVRNLIPSVARPHAVDGYRYAAWTDVSSGMVEPFVVALSERRAGDHEVVATMFLGATFLKYEQDFGAVQPRQLARFARTVAADVGLIAAAHDALLQA